jgi:two-component system, NarL family, invasion response regulator UvrY
VRYPVRLLLVDDHPIVLEGLRRILSAQPDLTVDAQAGSISDALRLRGQEFDVVCLDVALPDGDGLTHLPTIRRTWPQAAVLMVSMQPEQPYAARAIEAGASGYVPKGCAPSELVRAVRVVASGRRYLPAGAGGPAAGDLDALAALSPRELEVLRMLAEGRTVTEIGHLLHLSIKTVSTFKTRIHAKLGIPSLAELVRFADRAGIGGSAP